MNALINWTSTKKNLILLLSLLLFYAPKGVYGQITTIITASDVQSARERQNIFNTFTIQPGDSVKLDFNFSILPPGAVIDLFNIELTLAKAPSPYDELKIHLLQMARIEQMGTLPLDPASITNPRKSVGLPPDEVQSLIASNTPTLSLILSTKKAVVDFYSLDSPKNGNSIVTDRTIRPRLVVTYHIKPPLKNNQTPAELRKPDLLTKNWNALYADAQHSSKLGWLFIDAEPETEKYTSSKVCSLPDLPNKNVLMFNNDLYFTADKASEQYLYRINPLYGTGQKLNQSDPRTIFTPKLESILSNNGLFIISKSDEAQAININGPVFKALPYREKKETVSFHTFPIPGPDGSSYWSDNGYVRAFGPLPPNGSDFRIDTTWNFKSDVPSSIGLSRDGQIAYLVRYSSDTDIAPNITSINTQTGKALQKTSLTVVPDESDPAPLPVVLDNNTVLIRSKTSNCDKLYILDKNLKSLDTISGTRISQPVACGYNSFYYADGGRLTKYWNKESIVLKDFKEESLSQIVSNNKGIVFAITGKQSLFICDSTGKELFSAALPSSDRFGMIPSRDGSLYVIAGSELYSFRQVLNSRKVYQLNSFRQRELTTFRAPSWIINATVEPKEQVFYGSQSISISDNTKIKKGANAQFLSGGTISISKGFQVEKGAAVSFSVHK